MSLTSPVSHSAFSMRWKPVKSCPGSWSPSRPSMSGSRSPKLSATGSIRSQWRAGHRVQRLGAGDVAGLDGGDERRRLLQQRGGLGSARTAGSRRRPGPGTRPRASCGGLAGDGQRRADAVADHAGLAGRLVLAGGELDEQLAGEAGGDVLDLGHDLVALAVDVELGDLAAVVGHLEPVRCRPASSVASTSQASSVAETGDGVGRRAAAVVAGPAGGGVRTASATAGEEGGRRSRRDMLGGLRVRGGVGRPQSSAVRDGAAARREGHRKSDAGPGRGRPRRRPSRGRSARR